MFPVEYIGDIEKTKSVARGMAKSARPGDVFCLFGDLGAGKTEFARAFIQERCGNVKVGSPTYNIVLSYGDINHFDLYRIKDIAELEEIGFSESIANGISLIEWPQVAVSLIPANAKKVELSIISEDMRKIICS